MAGELLLSIQTVLDAPYGAYLTETDQQVRVAFDEGKKRHRVLLWTESGGAPFRFYSAASEDQVRSAGFDPTPVRPSETVMKSGFEYDPDVHNPGQIARVAELAAMNLGLRAA